MPVRPTTLLLLWLAFIGPCAADANPAFNDAELALLEAFGPWPMAVPDDPGNELSGKRWAEQLGQQLFHDTLFSANQTLSCASCHQVDKGFTDGLKTAQGAGQHVRNTQGLLNVGYQRWFGWDGGTDSLWAASLRPILSNIEMDSSIEQVAARLRGADYVLQALSEATINTRELDDESLVVLAAKAMGAFQRTLISPPTRFDEYLLALKEEDTQAQQRYPQQAARGMKLFFGEGNCHVCHFGPNFSNAEFHDTGRPFFTAVGQVDPGRHSGVNRVRTDPYNLLGKFNGTDVKQERQKTETVKLMQVNFGQWRTPSLRALTATAPYMHDGSLATLREVVDSYADIDPTRLHTQGEALIRPLNWSEKDRQAVVAFLETLSH